MPTSPTSISPVPLTSIHIVHVSQLVNQNQYGVISEVHTQIFPLFLPNVPFLSQLLTQDEGH